MTSLLHLKTTNSTGPIRPSRRQDFTRTHFTGVNMLILAQKPMAGVVLQIQEELDQVTWRRHEQRTWGNKEGTEDSARPVRAITLICMYRTKPLSSVTTRLAMIITVLLWGWVPPCNRNPKGLYMTSHIVALGTVVNPPSSPLTDSYDLKAEQHHPWAKCSVSETRMHSKHSLLPWQSHTQF